MVIPTHVLPLQLPGSTSSTLSMVVKNPFPQQSEAGAAIHASLPIQAFFMSFPQGVQRKSSDFIFGRTGILLCLLIRVISELSYEDAKWLF
jgi:hypothetical protein